MPSLDLSLYHEEPGFVCPAEFWPALGYGGAALLVGLWWEATTDEACWSDGHTTYIGAEPTAYRLLLERNFPPDHPAHWLLGAHGTPATMWLVIERPTGRAWLMPADDAADTVAGQHPAGQDTAADWFPESPDDAPHRAAVTGAWREPALSPGDHRRARLLEAKRHELLRAALGVARA